MIYEILSRLTAMFFAIDIIWTILYYRLYKKYKELKNDRLNL